MQCRGSRPKDLCGTKVSSAALEPVLPPGKKISAQPTSAVGVQRCRVQVDGKTVLSASTEKRAAGASARDVAMSAIGVEPTDASADKGQVIEPSVRRRPVAPFSHTPVPAPSAAAVPGT